MNIITTNENKEILDRLDIDVIKRVDGQFELRELLSKFVNLYFNKIIIDITSIKNYENVNVMVDLSKAIDPSRIILLLNNNPTVNGKLYLSTLVKSGIYNFTRNYEGITYLYSHPNTLKEVNYLILDEKQEKIALEEEQKRNQVQDVPAGERHVIGLANLTNHAGSSSLTNMMVRQLNSHGYKAIGVEMFKQDLIFYHDDEHYSSAMSKGELESKIKVYDSVDAIVVDLNDFGEADKLCDVILYLVEPSYIMLTKLLKRNKNAFLDHKEDKIVLNKSFVNMQELSDFEYETKANVFANIPPLNDRNVDLQEINGLLEKLGYKMSNRDM
jgi:hypothetical protein